MLFWCKTKSLHIFNTLANQHSCQLIFSSSYQNKWDLATFISKADQFQKFVVQNGDFERKHKNTNSASKVFTI